MERRRSPTPQLVTWKDLHVPALWTCILVVPLMFTISHFKIMSLHTWNTEDFVNFVISLGAYDISIWVEESEIFSEVIYLVQDKIGWQKGLGMSEVGCKYPLGRWTCSPWTCGSSFVRPDQHHPSSSTLIMVFMSSGYMVWSADILAAAEKPLSAT